MNCKCIWTKSMVLHRLGSSEKHPRYFSKQLLRSRKLSSSQQHKTRYPPPEHTCDPWIQQEIARYNPALPIEQAKTPPSTWYANSKMLDLELQSIFLDQWVAVDVVLSDEPGSYQTGCFAKQPYLLTRNEKGDLQAFYNVCTHAGSCLVGPWTTAGCSKLDTSLVGQSTHGNLFSSKLRGLQCPYHGWQFNLDGKLTKATNLKGIRDFSPKAYGLKAIPVEQLGPIVFLNFGSQEGATNGSRKPQEQHDIFISNCQLFSGSLEESGFHRDFGDLDLIESRQYTVQCNWKVVCDNYGDGCYHCSYAHQNLASNIDESNYSTQILSAEVSVQHAPPSADASCSRFGTERAAVYAQWYPNIMFNRYGPWLDVDIIKPINESTSVVHKAWFLERDFHPPNEVTRDEYIRDSLESSRRVHEEDAFLCENAQLGMSSRGFDRSRYVPSKQIAAQHFHQRLAHDLQRAARWNSI